MEREVTFRASATVFDLDRAAVVTDRLERRDVPPAE
jgi:hypothetical protein